MLNEKAKAIYEFIKAYWFQKVIWKKWTTTTVQLS